MFGSDDFFMRPYIWFYMLILIAAAGGCASWQRINFPSHEDVVGTWASEQSCCVKSLLTFYSDHRFEVDLNGDGQKDIWGLYECLGSTGLLKFIDAADECLSLCQTAGFYYYQITESQIHFKLYADECLPRKGSLSWPWYKTVRPPKQTDFKK